MASQLQLRRGTTPQHAVFVGAPGEVTVDTDKKTTVVHDGSTAGGFPSATSAELSAGLATKLSVGAAAGGDLSGTYPNPILVLQSYTTSTLPAATTVARLIYVSNGTANKRLAVSDGTNWRWPDGNVVS